MCEGEIGWLLLVVGYGDDGSGDNTLKYVSMRLLWPENNPELRDSLRFIGMSNPGNS